MRRHLPTNAAVGVALAMLVHAPAHAQAYDARPLRSPAAYPSNRLPTEPAALVRWLEQNARTLPEEGIVAAREQIFAIVSADAKRRANAGTPVLPIGTDTSIARLYEWAHHLGLPGARLVALRLGSAPNATDPRSIDTPGFTIAFDSLYTLTADADGWRVRFPHYFMIAVAQRQRMNDGLETSIAMLSTLFAKDSTRDPGASQATILLVSAPVPAPQLAASWLEQLGMGSGDTIPNHSPGAVRTYRARNAVSRMVRELVVMAPPGRAIVVAYIGLDGTFETNRPHFLNLLATLRVSGSSAGSQ